MVNKNKNIKKRKKKNSKKTIKIVLSIVILLIILLILILSLVFHKNKKIECTKEVNNNGIRLYNEIIIKMNDNNVGKVVVNKKISINKLDNKIDYLGAIRTALDDTYKKLNVAYSIKEQGNELIINLIYDKKQEYILDNILIDLENDGLIINIISEDRENNYVKINLSKEYDDKNIIKMLEKSDYKCK